MKIGSIWNLGGAVGGIWQSVLVTHPLTVTVIKIHRNNPVSQQKEKRFLVHLCFSKGNYSKWGQILCKHKQKFEKFWSKIVRKKRKQQLSWTNKWQQLKQQKNIVYKSNNLSTTNIVKFMYLNNLIITNID